MTHIIKVVVKILKLIQTRVGLLLMSFDSFNRSGLEFCKMISSLEDPEGVCKSKILVRGRSEKLVN